MASSSPTGFSPYRASSINTWLNSISKEKNKILILFIYFKGKVKSVKKEEM
jgi:hypothetical protein